MIATPHRTSKPDEDPVDPISREIWKSPVAKSRSPGKDGCNHRRETHRLIAGCRDSHESRRSRVLGYLRARRAPVCPPHPLSLQQRNHRTRGHVGRRNLGLRPHLGILRALLEFRPQCAVRTLPAEPIRCGQWAFFEATRRIAVIGEEREGGWESGHCGDVARGPDTHAP